MARKAMMKALLVLCTVVVLSAIVLGDDLMTPPFLVGAPESAMNELKNLLIANQNRPDGEVEAAIEKWVNSKGGTIKEKFELFKAQVKKQQEQAMAARRAIAKNLSLEARKADKELTKIGEDSSLNLRERQKKIEEFFKKLPLAIRNELMAAMNLRF